MAKRFIDTGIFDDTWFMDLSKDAKIAWLYLITKCDHAGIIEINEKLMILQTEIKSWGTVRQELNSRLIHLRDNYFFIPKFIQFQYPNFPKSNVNQQTGAIKRLCEFGLFCDGQVIDFQALNSSTTIDQDLTKSYGNGNVLYNNKKEVNYLEEDKQIFEEFRKLYKGTKRGLDIEFDNFRKKHSDWKEVNKILKECLIKQTKAREINKSNNQFVPQWKNLQTYINNRAWEEEICILELKQNGNTQQQSRMAFEQNIPPI